MSTEIDAVPTNENVKSQLSKMLSDPAFSTRPQQSKLFETIVRGWLLGDEITEKYLRDKLYPTPPYKPDSNVARRTVDLVKRILSEYYEEGGKDDLIIIGLPETPPGKRIKFLAGQAYNPTFKYNVSHPVGLEYSRALNSFGQCSLMGFVAAAGAFRNVAEMQPDHLSALIRLTETRCLLRFFGLDIVFEEYASFEAAAKRAVSLKADDWHAHAALGTAMFFLRNLNEAEAQFEAALDLNRPSTLNYRFYHLYLLCTGRKELAQELAKSFADRHQDNPVDSAVYAFFLYANRQYSDTIWLLREALQVNPECWLAHLIQGLVAFARERPYNAFRSLQEMERSFRCGGIVFPGLFAFGAAASVTPDPFEYIEYGVSDVKPPTEAGISEYLKEAKLQLIGQIRNNNPSWIQFAFYFWVTDQQSLAAEALDRAWQANEPGMLLAPILPIFDCFRGLDSFNAMRL